MTITSIPSAEARIETTTACNSHCTICPRDNLKRPGTLMTFSWVSALLAQMEKLGVTKVGMFGYGEPMLDWRLPSKIKAAAKRGMYTTITTNGSLIDDNRAELLLKSPLKHIRFSVHGITRETYEDVHRGLKWNDTIPRILHFIWMNENMYAHKEKIEVSVIPMHGESVEEIRRFWEPFVDILEIWRPHNWGGAKDFRKVVRKKQTCGRPDKGPLQIQSNGYVIPCCFLTNGEVILGNTHEKHLVDILNDEPYEKLREAHRTGNLEGYPCEHCDQLNEYSEEDNPLLYSSIDPNRRIGVTSITKYNLEA
jgi:radical SAM protein with 4Fe4S-binding SPASM domain